MDGQPSGLAATQVFSQTPAAANLIAGTSSNPLDDLVSIFGGVGSGGANSGAASQDPLGGLSFGNGAGLGASHAPSHVTMSTGTAKPGAPPQQPQEDLLGLF